MNKTVLFLVIILIFSCLLLSLFDGEVKKDFFLMDTVISAEIKGAGRDKALTDIETELERLNGEFSVNGKGILHSYNTAKETSKELSSIIKECEEISKKTNGAFDIGIYPVTKLWGFTKGTFRVPKEEEIKNALLKKGEEIDLGAYLKGYGADRIRAILEKAKIPEAVVSLGGTVLIYGSDEKNIAVKSPEGEGFSAYIKAENCVISTSGGYERNFSLGGKVYSHIINPKTGYPAESGIKSVTVISDKGSLSDAFSTAIYVMGEKEAIKLYEKEDFEFLLITDEDRLLITEGLYDKVFDIDEKYKIEKIKKAES